MIRPAVVFALALLCLAGCGGADERAPFLESRIPPSLGPGFWAPEGWTWGLIGVGEAPPQRYGVASTTGTPRGNLLILTDDREIAEVWFESVRDLNAQGYTVWVLERAGQGGSARYGGPRELIHVPTFDDDIAATKALARNIVQADPETPLTIIGQGLGGLIGLRAIETGAPAAAFALSGPTPFSAKGPSVPSWLSNLGAGGLPAEPTLGWRRDQADDFASGRTRDRTRGAVALAWQIANPDLRMGGHSLAWRSAAAEAAVTARTDLATVKVPTLAVTGDSETAGICARISTCRPANEPGGFLESGAARTRWLFLVTCAAPPHPRYPESRPATCPA